MSAMLPSMSKSFSQRDLNDRYREGVDYLDSNYAFFLTSVLNIGPPRWTPQLPTAAVGYNPDTETADDFRLMFNGDFAMTLEPSAMAFVQAHETMHILLEHLRIWHKFENKAAANIAADCLINDYLVNMGLDAPDFACRGEDKVGYDCANATVRTIYDDLIAQSQCPKCGGDGEQGEDGDGDGQGQPCDGCNGSGGFDQSGQFDDHSFMEKMSQNKAAQDAAQKMADAAQGKIPKDLQSKRDEDQGITKDSGGLMAGSGIGGEEKYAEAKGVSMKWVELLKKVNPDVFKMKPGAPPRPSYHLPRRKLAGLRRTNPDLNLPVLVPRGRDKGDVQAVVMALDTSGSIGKQDADRFITLARSVPTSKVKLFVCTFTTQYMPLDLDNPSYRSGGTDFSPIEQFIKDKVEPELNHYPKAVIVITDGQASFNTVSPKDIHKDRWFWLMYGYSTTNYINGIGQHQDLTEFTDGM